MDRVDHTTPELFRESLPHVLEAEPFPVAEADFLEFRTNPVGNVVVSADDAGSLQASFEIAGVDRIESGQPQPLSNVLELEQTHLGETHIRTAVNGNSLVTLDLPVPCQIQSTALFHGKA